MPELTDLDAKAGTLTYTARILPYREIDWESAFLKAQAICHQWEYSEVIEVESWAGCVEMGTLECVKAEERRSYQCTGF